MNAPISRAHSPRARALVSPPRMKVRRPAASSADAVDWAAVERGLDALAPTTGLAVTTDGCAFLAPTSVEKARRLAEALTRYQLDGPAQLQLEEAGSGQQTRHRAAAALVEDTACRPVTQHDRRGRRHPDFGFRIAEPAFEVAVRARYRHVAVAHDEVAGDVDAGAAARGLD